MKKKLTENLTLKIVSLILGVFVWLLVANIDNPIVTRSFLVQNVELLNEAYIDNTGMVCLKEDEKTPVRVTLKGNSKLLARISVDDIRVVADLQQAVSLDTDPVMIPVTAYCNGILAQNISVSPQNIGVTLEEKVTGEFLVTVSNGDTKPGKGYEIGSQTAYPEKVQVTGPRSLMKKLDKVVAEVDVTGLTQDKTESTELWMVDKNADTLSDVAMSNLRIGNEGKVIVTTRLWKIRTDVAVSAGCQGQLARGFVVNSITTVPETISVAGTEEALKTLRADNNTVWIPDECVDVEGASADVEAKVNLTQYLPDGMKLTSGSAEEVIVTVKIVPEESDIYTIPTSSIEVKNLKENYQAAFGIDKIELRVRALDGNISRFDISECKASIDLTDAGEGTGIIPVDIEMPEGYELIDKVNTEITISEISVSEESE